MRLLGVMPSLTPLPVTDVHLQVLRCADYLQVARRVVQCVTVYVVDMLTRLQLATQVLLHHYPVLWLVVAMTHVDVPVALLQILTNIEAFAYRLAMPTVEGIVVHAQALSHYLRFAGSNDTVLRDTIGFLQNAGVVILVPALVVSHAHLSGSRGLRAIINAAVSHMRQGYGQLVKGVA